MDTQPLKYFIYVRKSSEGKERQALSHEGQLDEIRKIVQRESLVIVDTYIESKSAHIPRNRPMFDEMLKRIRKGDANGILAWHTNRLSRNPEEGGIIQQMLQDEQIQSIVVPYRHFRSEDNALLFSIESSEANQYSRDLKAAVKRGLYQKCALGQPPIIAPPGYLNTKRVESGTNEIIPDPDRWHLIRMAFDLILSGEYSIGKAAAILNDEHAFRTRPSGQRKGRPIGVSVLHLALINPFYTGHFNYHGKTYKGSYKPMITLEEYDRVQALLRRKGVHKEQKHAFAVTGFIKCGSCGCAVTASKKLKQLTTTGEYRIYTFYHCTKRKGRNACAETKYTKEAEMEDMITTALQRIALQPKFKEFVTEMIRESHEEELQKHAKILQDTFDYEGKLKRELETCLTLGLPTNCPTPNITKRKLSERCC